MVSLRVCAISDLHGRLPATLPPADVLAIGGDICPDFGSPFNVVNQIRQLEWLNVTFKAWLHRVQRAAGIQLTVATPGNHDFALFRKRAQLDPGINWHLLIDEGVTVDGLSCWGTPWVTNLRGWAFNLPETIADERFRDIPDGVDLVVSHLGPLNILDQADRPLPDGTSVGEFECTGSLALRTRIDQVCPALMVFGHIHEARGALKLNETWFVNASVVNRRYEPVHQPWVQRIDFRTTAPGTSDTETGHGLDVID